MSPRAFTIVFAETISPERTRDILKSLAPLGGHNLGTHSREHYVVIERPNDLREFEALVSALENEGVLTVGPLGS